MQEKGKRATIRDVANLAGVSIGTVSRVINDSGYVSEKTRKKIDKAMLDTGFRPNITAQSMIRKKSALVGVAVPEINNPYVANLVVLIERLLNKQNLSIILCNTRYSQRKFSSFIGELISRNAEGLISIALNSNDEQMIKEVERFIPTVCANSRLGNFDSVNATDWQSTFEMMEYLIEMGHRKIAFMGYNEFSTATMERLRGYHDTLQKHGIARRPEYELPSKTESSMFALAGNDLARELLNLPDPPTAIFAVNDFYAISCYMAVKERGLEVGRDISVVGFDDLYLASLVNPPITTVHYDIQLVAETVTDLLLKRSKGKGEETKHIMVPGTIIKRDSVRDLRIK